MGIKYNSATTDSDRRASSTAVDIAFLNNNGNGPENRHSVCNTPAVAPEGLGAAPNSIIPGFTALCMSYLSMNTFDDIIEPLDAENAQFRALNLLDASGRPSFKHYANRMLYSRHYRAYYVIITLLSLLAFSMLLYNQWY